MKPSTYPCLICGEKFLYDRDVMDTVLLSYRYLCPHGHFEEDYNTGSTCYRVGNEEFFEHYSDDRIKEESIRRDVHNAVLKQRDIWHHMETELNSRIPKHLLAESRAFQAATGTDCPSCRATARAVFGDWLEEHGFGEEAEWQRMQSKFAEYNSTRTFRAFNCDACKKHLK